MIAGSERGPSSADPPRPAEPIDAVYLWVEGADPEIRASMARHRPREGSADSADAAGAQRFRDNGELRFSLRSLEFHAPRIRHVHLVTNGQALDWLDLGHPRLSLVPQAAIYPDPSHLPSFNSCLVPLRFPVPAFRL